jgi:hypothetical protein
VSSITPGLASVSVRRDTQSRLAASVAVAESAVIYGTDVFSALVLHPAAADASDASVADLVERIHHYGDRRLPVPGVTGAPATVVTAVLADTVTSRVAATTAALAQATWLGIYLGISAPINKELRAAAASHSVPSNTRALQQRWDAVIWPRAALRGVALGGLLVVLIRR